MAGLGALLLLTSACNKNKMNNPFFSPWDTPYGIPAFDAIRPEHYLPAFREGMKQQKAEVAAIVANREAPTFDNTIEALERSGELLNSVSSVFFNLAESNHTAEMEAIEEEVTPLLSAHNDDINLNAELFARVKAVYDSRPSLKEEQQRLLDETFKNFVRNGANVPVEHQERFRQLNEQLAQLEMRFGNNVLKATNAYTLLLDEGQLDGLTQSQIAAAKADAEACGAGEGKYAVTLQAPSWEPFLTNSTSRELRQRVWQAYSSRCMDGDFDNRAIIDSLVNLRLERAQLLGYESHAAYVLDDCLAKTPQNVYDCLMQIWTPALQKAKTERDAYQQLLKQDCGDTAQLQPWDWRFYAERLRQARYDLDDDTLRPYFSLENVRRGAFDVASKLYGIRFKENPALPVYDKEVRAFEVEEADGSTIAILYMDFFPRSSKRSGAWMTNFREQYVDAAGHNVIPIIQVVTNFTRPTNDVPSLLSFDEAETLFHEFGHALHSILSRCRYRSLSGTNVPRDFVEMPSQIMENWCRHPQVMRRFAHHYVTGEPIPDTLISKLEAAATYGQGFANTELLAASLLDMDYHTLTRPTRVELPDFEENAMKRIGLIPEIISRYRSCYFQHIFTTGYSAGYYSYTWTAILDADAFQAFVESGDLYNPELARRFRNILQHGNTKDLMSLYVAFRGREPRVEALLRNRGLTSDGK